LLPQTGWPELPLGGASWLVQVVLQHIRLSIYPPAPDILACGLCPAVLPQTGWPELPPGIASWLVQVVRFIILLAQAVPISLYVSLETVKVAQCKVRQHRMACTCSLPGCKLRGSGESALLKVAQCKVRQHRMAYT
jgi:hypothetical protein